MSFSLKLFGAVSLQGPSGPLAGRAVQRRRLALLALLAVTRRRGMSREKLVAFLWPDADGERGRHLLSDSIYRINQALGAEAISPAGDELRLARDLLPSDVAEFEEAIEKGEWERAVAAYAGPLLDGFFISEAPEFERWVEEERARLAREYAKALERLAEAAEGKGDGVRAAHWWRTLATEDPYSSRVALRLVRALDAVGERAAALQHVRVHETLLREEFGAEPDPELVALATRLRSHPAPKPAVAEAATGSSEAPDGAAAPTAREVVGASVGGQAPAPRSPARRLGVRVALVVLGALLVFAVWSLRKQMSPAASAATSPPTIAVLPFLDLSPQRDQEYFSDGVTEELINSLSKVGGLRVASRTSVFAFKHKSVDVRDVGARLGVASVLEGSVRKADNRLRITAQLVSVADGYHLWSETYDREMKDVFAVQEEISRAIVTTLRARLVGGSDAATLGARSTGDVEAYNLYLKGRYFWHRRTEDGLTKAAEYFEQAVARAPDYARAYVGLGDAYAVLGFYDYLPPREAFPKAKAAAMRALALDPTLAAPHATLGYVALYHDWDWPRAEQEFRRAVDLDPAYSTAHQWYANLLTAMGRFDEAEREMRTAQELDPLSLIANAALGWVLYYAGEYERAIEQCRRTLDLNPSFELAYLWAGLALEELGRLTEASEMVGRAVALSEGNAISRAALARARALAGNRRGAAELLTDLERKGRGGYAPAYEIAKVYLALGRSTEALQWLERAYEHRSHSLVFLKVDPQLRALRSDAKFAELMRRVGLEGQRRRSNE